MRHSGEKKYKCPLCTYSCIQATTYKVHVRRKHSSDADGIVFHCTRCLFKTLKEGNFLAHLAGHGSADQDAAAAAAVGAAAAVPGEDVAGPSEPVEATGQQNRGAGRRSGGVKAEEADTTTGGESEDVATEVGCHHGS